MEISQYETRRPDHFYAVINCHGDESGKYTVFYGVEAKNRACTK